MRKKLTAIIALAMMIVCIMPIMAKADMPTYNYNDMSKLKSFLEIKSDGVKNGNRINEIGYNADDPTTWTGVIWSSAAFDKRVVELSWMRSDLVGSLNLSDFAELTKVAVSQNSITEINVTNDTALKDLWINNNSVSSLDLSTNTMLTTLKCEHNLLHSLDTSAAGTNMVQLNCNDNFLTSLNISGNTNLGSLTCNNNQLTSIDLSGFSSLTDLWASNNLFTSVNFTGCTALEYINIGTNKLTSVDLSGLTALEKLICSSNSLTSLDLSGLTALKQVFCESNEITSLDFTDNPLTDLNCDDNNISTLDLTAKTGLLDLGCSNNNLSALDLTKNTLLQSLDFKNNDIATIDLSKNTALQAMDCSDNELTTLDLSKNTALIMMDCSNNKLTTLDTNASNLIYIICLDNPLKQITAKISGDDISLKALGNGYVGVNKDMTDYYAKAYAISPYTFINWTKASAEVGTNVQYDLTAGTVYDLVANFTGYVPDPTPSKLTADPVDAKIFVGGRIKITPSTTGGTWSFDETYLKRDGETFTALKAGTVRVSYTVNSQTEYIDVTISETLLPQTGQDYTPIYVLIAVAGLMLIAGIGLSVYASKKEI